MKPQRVTNKEYILMIAAVIVSYLCKYFKNINRHRDFETKISKKKMLILFLKYIFSGNITYFYEPMHIKLITCCKNS